MHKHSWFLAGLILGASAPALALQAVQLPATFSQPLFLTAPGGDSRLFVVEKGGRIQVMQGNTVSTYLDISARVDTNGERGLLGMAFDPGFASNGRFYVDYVDKTTLSTVVASFTAPSAASSTADPATRQQIIAIAQPAGRTNHKGGWIGFRATDPGQLYIATGDGGSSNDPDNNAQNLNSNLGKILRITPSAGGGYAVPGSNPFVGKAGNDEIWAYGVRNPFRNSFDRQNGDFWIADVGQDTREEIDLQTAASLGGINYGWRAREGKGDNPGVGDTPPANATDPIFDYEHGAMGQSIIGGYVYRGSTEPGLDGSYFFGDFVSGRIFTLRRNGNGISDLTDRTVELGTPFGANTLSSFGQDAAGNIYVLGINGDVFRIAAVPEPGTWAMLAGGLFTLSLLLRRRHHGCLPQ